MSIRTQNRIIVVLIAVAVALAIQTHYLPGLHVTGESMAPTLQGDPVVYCSTRVDDIRPGDVVVVDRPRDDGTAWCKRVIAMGGDTVHIDSDGVVWRNGQPLEEPYVSGPAIPQGVATEPVEIPAGYVWVMGDNRAVSYDSRYVGPVPASSVRYRYVCTAPEFVSNARAAYVQAVAAAVHALTDYAEGIGAI